MHPLFKPWSNLDYLFRPSFCKICAKSNNPVQKTKDPPDKGRILQYIVFFRILFVQLWNKIIIVSKLNNLYSYTFNIAQSTRFLGVALVFLIYSCAMLTFSAPFLVTRYSISHIISNLLIKLLGESPIPWANSQKVWNEATLFPLSIIEIACREIPTLLERAVCV